MDNYMDDDDSEEIIPDDDEVDYDTGLYFADQFAQASSSDESSAAQGDSGATGTSEPSSQTSGTAVVDSETLKKLNEFSIEKFSQELFAVAGTGDLLTCLHKHWKTYVPLCFSVSDNPTNNLTDTNSIPILFKPLENYLCACLDSEKRLKSLNELDDPPQLCGKVFKSGEPSYFCRDCGSDPTCVLCSNCFRQSKHRNHKYKMMTSAGGGYCDCGDTEAWKHDPYCELHKPKSSEAASSSSSSAGSFESKLPADVRQRATELFGFVLEYIFEMMSNEKSEELPGHLKPDSPADDYVTMLYNDEVHSYEQVVGTLRKVLIIDDKKAFDYAAIVDKEGRSAIKRSKKSDCDAAKTRVETVMAGPQNPLKTRVMHHSLVSHQYFAERAVSWLQKVCEYSKGLKEILCKVGLFAKPDSHSLLEKLMLADNVFWKSARTVVHQFFISIYFMDPAWKREFAGLYAKNYKLIWRNFINNPDDTVSLTDLAVQMFTVISLSKHLIAKYNILETIMETLVEHSKTDKGKLSFPRTRQRYSNMEFKRAQFILFDFKYCLTSAPVNEWTDELRKNFINGFKAFTEFIKFMHGMDAIERYTQQHVEFEPEWETSFNLLIKLQKSINSLIDWLSTDKQVYFECYKYLLNAIHQVETNDPMFSYTYEKRKFNGQSYETINFAVIKSELSIHAPLTRLFAGIYAQMYPFGCDFVSIASQLQSSSLNPLSSLKHDLPQQKMVNLIEPSLRALVLVSQTNAGLWKRNGFSLLSQVYFYSNIKCRHEMFDRDILCLQMGASVLEPNEFLVSLSSRFNLFDYFNDDNFEVPADSPPDYYKSEYLLPVAEDFLELLIHLVSERFEAHLSQISVSQKLEREAIHQLCISPMAHSDLVKNIYPDNEKYTNELESVLHRIAIFKNALSGTNAKGTYELKEEFFSQYSPYFYHYVRSDKTKSEEYQLGLRKNEKEKFFRPPVLPRWTKLFEKVSHLLDSDFFIRILFSLLRRFSNKAKLLSEGQIARILHLVGLALHEEQADIDSQAGVAENPTYSFKFIEKSIINFKRPSSGLFAFKSSKTEESLLKYLNEIAVSANLPDQLKLLATWNIEYAQRLLKIKNKSNYQQRSEDKDESSAKAGEASSSKDEDEAARIESENIKRKNQIAEKRRAKVLAQFNQMQKNFIRKNKDLYEESAAGGSEGALSRLSSSDAGKLTSESSDYGRIVCIGPNQTNMPVLDASKTRYRCILCQEDQNISIDMPPMVLCCYVQSSRVLTKRRKQRIENFDKFEPLFMENSLYWGINTTSCGHVMHANCWQKYVDTVRLAENRRHARMFGFSVKRNEYLCPLCETIGNTVLPLFPDLKYLSRLSASASESSSESLVSRSLSDDTQRKKIALSYDDWLDGLEKTLENSVKQELQDDKDVFIINPCPLSTITKLMADAVASNFKLLFEFESFVPASVYNMVPKSSASPTSSPTPANQTVAAASSSSPVLSFLPNFFSNEIKLNSETVGIMENFTRISYTFGLTTLPDDTDPRMPISMWSNCAFTIQVAEQLLRIENKPLFGHLSLKQSDLLSNIVKQAALYGIVMHSDSIRKSCVRLLAAILPYKTGLYDSLDIMKVDLFHFLVSLCLSMPNLYDKPKITSVATGGINDSYIFQLALQAHCVQILISKLKSNSFASPEPEDIKMVDEDEIVEPMSAAGTEQTTTSKNKDEEIVYELFKSVVEKLRLKNNYSIAEADLKAQLDKANRQTVFKSLKLSLMPFLRSCSLFFSNLTDLVPSVTIANDTSEFVDNNFNELLQFLGVQNGLASVLDLQSNSFKTLFDHWLSSPNASPLTSVNLSADLIEYPIKVNEFIDLPKDYIDLISLSMSNHVCSSNQKTASSLTDNSSDPATILCLICGEMLCSQANCCQQEIGKKRVGSCTAHAYKCSGTVGVFLRVAECQVLLLHLNINSEDDLLVRGCMLPAPYLDDYGETDQGLRRGNPLRLCKARYQKLYKDWLSHSIPDEVSRSYQNNQTTLITVEWSQL